MHRLESCDTEGRSADEGCETNHFSSASGATAKDPLIAFVMAESLLRSKRDDHQPTTNESAIVLSAGMCFGLA